MRAATQRLLDKRCSTQLRTRFACRCRLRHAVARSWSTLAPSTITRDREESPDGTYAAAEAGVMTGPAAGRPGDRARPKVFLHIGEPKTGTTFLQQVMWGNRAGLAVRASRCPATTLRTTTGPARTCAACRCWRPTRRDRGPRVGDSRPSGEAGAEGRRHLARAVLRRRRRARRACRQVAAAGQRARHPHRAGHGHAIARRVAGVGEAPQRPRLGRLARRRDRPGVAGTRAGAGGGSGACTTRWPSSTSGRGTCRPSGYT